MPPTWSAHSFIIFSGGVGGFGIHTYIYAGEAEAEGGGHPTSRVGAKHPPPYTPASGHTTQQQHGVSRSSIPSRAPQKLVVRNLWSLVHGPRVCSLAVHRTAWRSNLDGVKTTFDKRPYPSVEYRSHFFSKSTAWLIWAYTIIHDSVSSFMQMYE